jgi:hypothetical protein
MYFEVLGEFELFVRKFTIGQSIENSEAEETALQQRCLGG